MHFYIKARSIRKTLSNNLDLYHLTNITDAKLSIMDKFKFILYVFINVNTLECITQLKKNFSSYQLLLVQIFVFISHSFLYSDGLWGLCLNNFAQFLISS